MIGDWKSFQCLLVFIKRYFYLLYKICNPRYIKYKVFKEALKNIKEQ